MATFSYCGVSGGHGGNKFDDGQTANRKIVEVKINSGWYVDAIQLVYSGVGGGPTPKHGGGGGTLKVFKLAADEDIVEVGGKHGDLIDSIYIKTSKGRTEKWGGSGGYRNFIYRVPPGTRIDGFWGYTVQYVKAIGVIMFTP